MEDKKSDVNKKNNGTLNVNLSAGDNKIKYYECNKDNCIFEIVDNKDEKDDDPIEFDDIKYDDEINTEDEFKFLEEEDYPNIDKQPESKRGIITVKSIIDYGQK